MRIILTKWKHKETGTILYSLGQDSFTDQYIMFSEKSKNLIFTGLFSRDALKNWENKGSDVKLLTNIEVQ